MKCENSIHKSDTYALIEGPRWADCKFYAAWLLAAAETQAFWDEALKETDFYKQVERLCCWYIPSFEITACALLMRIKKQLSTFIIDVDGEFDVIEFCMMISLGFFQLTGSRYQMTIPSRLDMAKVKESALALAKTEDAEYYLHPEDLIVTMPGRDAKAWQKRLRSMDQPYRIVDRLILLEG